MNDQSIIIRNLSDQELGKLVREYTTTLKVAYNFGQQIREAGYTPPKTKVGNLPVSWAGLQVS